MRSSMAGERKSLALYSRPAASSSSGMSKCAGGAASKDWPVSTDSEVTLKATQAPL
ncbi:Uncharacterised protein [Bordetella trematum]|nr:Uncharacterised protein [Bordetella trematum]SAI44925.1 Uncharacterised protein [Bordetella trematum]